ncbi:hybrid sensor histidine kinase/response regulator [Acidisoma sp. C75]
MPPPPSPADLRQELLAAFEVEYRDHLVAVRLGIAAARQGQQPDLRELFRRLHSLKGAARAVDLDEAERLAHALENEMASVIEAGGTLPPGWDGAMEAALDRLETAIAAGLGTGEARPAAAGAPNPEPNEHSFGYLPIDAAQITDLVIATGTLAQAIERQGRLAQRVQGLEAAIEAVRRLPGPAPHGTIADLARQVAGLRHEVQDGAFTLGQSFRRVRDDVYRLSLVAAETVFGPMARVVRELARDEGLAVETEFLGLGLSADRRLLQALKDPVMQLLRNAVSHGAEPPARRRARGLPPATRILLSVRGGGGSLKLTVSDDGPGPDLAAIRARAVERGLLSPAEAESAAAERILALVFEAGLSTRADVGALSGRGMGLSIVAEAARAFGGEVRMRFAEDRAAYGTAVEITVPLLLSRQSAVLLRFEDATVALPAGSVIRLLRVPLGAIQPVAGQMCVRIAEAEDAPRAPVAVLGALLGMAGPRLPAADGMAKLAVIRGSVFGQRLALAVDEFEDVRRFLTHRAELVGTEPDLVSGLVMVTSERPAALLSPDGIFARWQRRGGWGGAAEGEGEAGGEGAGPEPWPQTAASARTILVVDDSITSRTLEKSILEAQGYKVRVAVDGVEALEILRASSQAAPPTDLGEATAEEIDLVLADVEMPRMDGFTLLTTMKDDPRLCRIPVIIMTSRDTAGDVRRGLELGASAYIAKQSFDQQELLATIGRLL